jgi:ABC-type branched-subunit amino acid transport system ATPase component
MAAGRVLTQGKMSDIRKDTRVVEAYFGGGKAAAA